MPKFREVAKILSGKRPTGPGWPATSVWEVDIGTETLTVSLKGQIIESVTPSHQEFVGQPFVSLTRHFYQRNRWISLKLLSKETKHGQ